MSVKATVKRSRPRKGRSDWARVRSQTDAAIARAIGADPDAAPLADAEWFSTAEVVLPTPKTAVSIRLDREVVEWFKRGGPKYQSRINAVLRAYVRAQTKARS